MNARGVIEDRDFAALVANAEPIGQHQPERPVAVPSTARSFAFQMDRDLTKIVSLVPRGDELAVAVIYANETVLDRQDAVIRLTDGPTLTTDATGVVVEWRQPLVGWLRWPRVRRKRRF